jgi:hypothetical protein
MVAGNGIRILVVELKDLIAFSDICVGFFLHISRTAVYFLLSLMSSLLCTPTDNINVAAPRPSRPLPGSKKKKKHNVEGKGKTSLLYPCTSSLFFLSRFFQIKRVQLHLIIE